MFIILLSLFLGEKQTKKNNKYNIYKKFSFFHFSLFTKVLFCSTIKYTHIVYVYSILFKNVPCYIILYFILALLFYNYVF